MEFPERYPTSIHSDSTGWILVHSLILILIIQAAAMFALTLIKYDIKSSTVFCTLLKQAHAPELKERPPVATKTVLDAPQGWDHSVFSTEVLERAWGNTRSYSWRVCLREQPFTTEHDPAVSVIRPHIIILIDDCLKMNSSCGKNYEKDSIYLEKTHGEIVEASYRGDVSTSLSSSEGTYFRGDYGDMHYQAPDDLGFGGTIPVWTFVQSFLKDLVRDLDLCEIAIATTSGGIVQPFTRDHATLVNALEGIRPDSATAPLSEALFDILDDFPDTCATSRHVIVATSGVAIDDGNLPSWLKDFDNDGNALDTYVTGPGSHCLDDVAAYAASRKVAVHTAGPDSAFLNDAAQKGKGVYLPGIQDFLIAPDYVCQMRVLSHNLLRFLTNRGGRFDPGWLIKTTATFYQAGPYDPLYLTVLPGEYIRGPATSHYSKGNSLFCTTIKDCLLSIDALTGDLVWMIQGMGGKISWRDGVIIAGPDQHGYINALTGHPALLWRLPGDLYDASCSSTYIARQDTITSVSLQSGQFLTTNTAGTDITTLLYDPCRGIVIAGTKAGCIHVFDQDLGLADIMTTNAPGSILSIHTFDQRKTLYIIAFTSDRAICMTLDKEAWSFTVNNGSYLNAVVMDSKLYLTTWNKNQGCEGIDTGKSYLVILNALNGDKVSEDMLFAGKAFGPLIDLEKKVIEYTSWDMSAVQVDISSLHGTGPVSLGMMRTDKTR